MLDPLTSDYCEVVDVKVVVGGSALIMPEASSSSAILRENRTNGSENAANLSPVYAVLRRQGDRMERILDLYQHQLRTLENYGASITTQLAALTTQGDILKQQGDTLMQQADILKRQGDKLDKHGQVIFKLLGDQKRLQDRVEKEFGRQGSMIEQQQTKLKVIEGRVDKLCEGRRGNPRNLRCSTRLQASKVQQAPASGSQVKYQLVECIHCGKTLSSSYIRHHVPKCPAFLEGQQLRSSEEDSHY